MAWCEIPGNTPLTGCNFDSLCLSARLPKEASWNLAPCRRIFALAIFGAMSDLQQDLRRSFPQIADFIQARDGGLTLVDNGTPLAVLLTPGEWTSWQEAVYEREFDRSEAPDYFDLYTNLFGEHRITEDTDYNEHLFMVSIISNIGCLNEGIDRGLNYISSHCIYPLLRTWIERCALVIYVTDNPHYIKDMESAGKTNLKPNSFIMEYALTRNEELKDLHDSVSGAMIYKGERILTSFTNVDTQEYVSITFHTDVPREDDLNLEDHIARLGELSLRLIERFIETRVLKYCRLDHDCVWKKIP